MTKANQLLGSSGEHPRTVALDARLRPGDSLETRSCDAWVELELRDGTRLTMAGHSTVRVLEETADHSCFKLLGGSLWVSPSARPAVEATLYAVALSVARSGDPPVLLEAGSRLVFRGRTDRAQTVWFGPSTQKMRGVFAGKFEVDVEPESLGPPGESWEVALALSEFWPLQPQWLSSPEGLELTDAYALTIEAAAGLEIHHIAQESVEAPR